eukprot:TRINITY_DN4985_c0_g1_i2.p2 TRINITY_DN4985_c0_g1~~TRINITY_DN4985_c0_g1_i2.p2  ORF type:complete len:170 (+),score=52.94 TRINITY_DN4985_c0_g1_i2:1075-1584(+)
MVEKLVREVKELQKQVAELEKQHGEQQLKHETRVDSLEKQLQALQQSLLPQVEARKLGEVALMVEDKLLTDVGIRARGTHEGSIHRAERDHDPRWAAISQQLRWTPRHLEMIKKLKKHRVERGVAQPTRVEALASFRASAGVLGFLDNAETSTTFEQLLVWAGLSTDNQ